MVHEDGGVRKDQPRVDDGIVAPGVEILEGDEHGREPNAQSSENEGNREGGFAVAQCPIIFLGENAKLTERGQPQNRGVCRRKNLFSGNPGRLRAATRSPPARPPARSYSVPAPCLHRGVASARRAAPTSHPPLRWLEEPAAARRDLGREHGARDLFFWRPHSFFCGMMCAARARMISKLILRVAAIRTNRATSSTQRRRADNECPPGERKL